MLNTSIPHLYDHMPSSVNGTLDYELNTNSSYNYDDYYKEDFDPSAHSPCDYRVHGTNILPVLYSLFFVVGFLGNMLVVWVILKSIKPRSMTDICFLNLAFADLLLVSTLPFLAHYARDQWIFGGPMCTMVLSGYHIGFYSGIFFVVLMIFDQYLAVVHAVFAQRVRTRTYGILVSVVIWIVAVLASFPELMHLKVSEHNNKKLCKAYLKNDQTSNHFLDTFGIFKMNILGLLIPLGVIGFCCSMILKRLPLTHSSRKEAMRLIIVVMVFFFCCWTPYNAAAFVRALELNNIIAQSCDSSKKIILSLQITEAMAYSHSCMNSILYVFVGEKFRNHLFRLLYKTPCSRIQFLKNYLTHATVSVYSQTSVEERPTTVV